MFGRWLGSSGTVNPIFALLRSPVRRSSSQTISRWVATKIGHSDKEPAQSLVAKHAASAVQ
jgi:hypothetical protein